MFPSYALVLVIGFFTIVCLLMFLVPVYFIWYRPHLDTQHINGINTAAIVLLCLPFISLALFRLFNSILVKTGSPIQAGASVAMVLLLTAVVAAYSKLTGIKADISLGTVAGLVFCGVWLATSNLALAMTTVALGFVLLILLFIYHKYTQNRVDLSTAQIGTFSMIGLVIITVICAAYYDSSRYHPDESPYYFLGPACFALIFVVIRFGPGWWAEIRSGN